MRKHYFLLLITIAFTFALKAQTKLTQSMDSATIDIVGGVCRDVTNDHYEDNHFYRVYNLSSFGVNDDFQISSVEFGQGKANNGKLITLNIYTASSEDLTTANLTLIGNTTHTCSSSDNLSLISKPLSLLISSGAIVVFEIYAAIDTNSGTTEDFVPGFNNAGEMDDSYIKAPFCNATTEPKTLTDFGAPSQQYVMNVVGSEVLSVKDFESFELGITPNPASSFINIKLDQTNRVKTAELYDVMGKLVLQSYKTNTLDISRLKTGMYILKLNTDRGNAVRRIVKQ